MMASSHSADASATTATTANSGSGSNSVAEEEQDSSNATATTTIVLKFVPFQSAVESAFWVRYCRAKLETIQLNETAVPLRLSYSPVNNDNDTNNKNGPRLQCRDHSLQLLEDEASENSNNQDSSNNECVTVTGRLLSFNTLEDFQKADKNRLLCDHFMSQFYNAQNDETLTLQSLKSVLLLTLADLKQHRVLYWFACCPVLAPFSNPIRAAPQFHNVSSTWAAPLARAVDAMRRQHGLTTGLPPFFLVRQSQLHTTCLPLSRRAYQSLHEQALQDGMSPEAIQQEIVFGFFDPLGQAGDETMMGWPMRNLVAYLSCHLGLGGGGGGGVPILSYRPRVLRRIPTTAATTVETFAAAEEDAVMVPAPPAGAGDKCLLLSVHIPLQDDYEDGMVYKVVGWELNARGKPGPRSVNLKPLLDPNHLAIQAADLNLKLMKWRMIPNLNVDMLQTTKVLLIGAGTLGCNVARVLLGWGVRHFTFVDYGKVSYSNPVRQSLFTLDDCHADGGSGRPKAAAAAQALHTIAADVHSQGIALSVPMPGHPDSDDILRLAVERLDALIQATDVVFLLTDTRESRWLPTVMAAAHDKILINAALGLDSWLVMRHGGGIVATTTNDTPRRLGCYFCSDVVAPENSTKNRTLDQQCTVTRPGLALIAGSMAAEVMVALRHHPEGIRAPAPPASTTSNFSPTVPSTSSSSSSSPLGVVPHQIRGSLVSYTMMTPTVPAFRHCTGCAPEVVEAYRNDKVGVVLQCCQSGSSYLEDLAGLTQFREEAAVKLEEMGNWDDE